MTKWVRLLLVVALVAAGAFGTAGTAVADFENSDATNQQDGDNAGSAEQAGGSESGDAVGGQVTGVVSSGDASVDATNRSEDVDVQSGNTVGHNSAESFVGLNTSSNTELSNVSILDFDSSTGINQQEGDNALDLTQTADASSGDAVGGQVIGAVTSAGGSADIVADNASEDVDVETGNADAGSDAASFVGLNYNTNFLVVVGIGDPEALDFEFSDAVNQQDGDNDASLDQTADASTGDGVAGQVIGAVSAGDTSIDARNRSEDADIETGDADAHNGSAAVVGLNTSFVNVVIAIDFESSTGTNQQDGDNSLDQTQTSTASTGDGVGGQVIGAVTSAGGSADIVADNASEDVDVETGNADTNNAAATFVGLNYNTNALVVEGIGDPEALDFEFSDAVNQQDGDNDASLDQTADASTGDGVAGQVIGAVSAGDTSIDARNRSEDADIETGDADAHNGSAAVVGLNTSFVNVVIAIDFESSTGTNQQDGDNSLDQTQTATASTGDGVGGQVIGAVTSAGGSADIVADNASEDVDVETGNADAGSAAATVVGLNYNTDTLVVEGIGDVGALDFENSGGVNQQDGDNDASLDQMADASTGDGVAGQVIGAVSAGDTSIDARNRSEDVDIETGDADAHNGSGAVVGLNTSFVNVVVGADFESSTATNQQDGDNSLDLGQTATASTGDGVGGQVIGAVTAAGGSADIVADNASEDVEIETGDANAHNAAASFVGLNFNTDALVVVAVDFEFSTATNQQDGDNSLSGDQMADASSGDGVGGQVLGVVSAGDTSLDARNRSEDVDIETGDADALNLAASFVGLNVSTVSAVVTGLDFESSTGTNQQDGDNAASFSQTATASSGDAVGGQVAGVVTSAGGSVDAVLDNASEDIDTETGGSTFQNEESLFVGLNFSTEVLLVAPGLDGGL